LSRRWKAIVQTSAGHKSGALFTHLALVTKYVVGEIHRDSIPMAERSATVTRRVQPARGTHFCEAETSGRSIGTQIRRQRGLQPSQKEFNLQEGSASARLRRQMPVTTSSPKYCFTWIHLWRDAAGVLEATLKVSGCELWCAVVSRVRCGLRAAAKLPWFQVVADAVRLRFARRCMTEVGTAVRLGGVVVWRRYAAARRCFAAGRRHCVASLCGCAALLCCWAASLCGVAMRLRGVAVLLGGIIVWRRYAAVRRCCAAGRRHCVALLCGCAALLCGVIMWRHYAPARRCYAAGRRRCVALLCGYAALLCCWAASLCGVAMRRRRCYADAAAAAAAASLWHCYAAAALLCGCGCG
jgi:hypothetical protein